MAAVVGTIYMRVAQLAALVAFCNNIFGNSFAQPVIENKIFTNEFRREMLLFDFIGIVNNAAFQMKNIFKTMVQHVSAGFLTTDSAGTIHDDIFFFISFH